MGSRINAGVHIPLVPEHLREAPYIGVLFILLSVACVALAIMVTAHDTPWIWAISAALSPLALIAFVWSRTIGLPQITDDIGNWTEPLCFPTVAAEALTVALVLVVLTGHQNRQKPGPIRSV